MLELRLHSPAGAEPIVYQWPLTSGSGNVNNLNLFYCLLLIYVDCQNINIFQVYKYNVLYGSA